MKFGRVMGTVVATVKDRTFTGKKLLLIQPLDGRGLPLGSPIVGMDSVGAGAGELILYVGGKEASFPFSPEEVPVDAGIVAIVDEIDRTWEFPTVEKPAETSLGLEEQANSTAQKIVPAGQEGGAEKSQPPEPTDESFEEPQTAKPQPVVQKSPESKPLGPEPEKRGGLFRRRKRSKRKRS